MKLTTIAKGAVPVLVGVILAGIVMNNFADVPGISDAAKGFNK